MTGKLVISQGPVLRIRGIGLDSLNLVRSTSTSDRLVLAYAGSFRLLATQKIVVIKKMVVIVGCFPPLVLDWLLK